MRRPFEGVIWDTIVSSESGDLILDVRDIEKQTVQYFKLSLESCEVTALQIGGGSWWSKMEAFDGTLFTSEYQDKNDPNRKTYFKWLDKGKADVSHGEIPAIAVDAIKPSIYELGTPYHKTVSNFLSLEIPCSCEYLEIGNKIIMSYYLRSGKKLDRFLLLLEDGKKVIKEVQDSGVHGFAPGAFFAIDDKLLFVKNRNEICIHTL